MAFMTLYRVRVRDRPALAVGIAHDALAVFADRSLHAGSFMGCGIFLACCALLPALAGILRLRQGNYRQRQTCSQHSNPQLLHKYSSICVSFVLGPMSPTPLTCLAFARGLSGARVFSCLRGKIPRRHLALGFLLGNSVALLNFADQTLTLSMNHVEIIVGEFSPLRPDSALHLHPLTFCPIPIHECLVALPIKWFFGEQYSSAHAGGL